MSEPVRQPDQRLAEIRAKLRSVNVENVASDDLEYASDLDFLLAELAALEQQLTSLQEAVEAIAYAPNAEAVRLFAHQALAAAGDQQDSQ